MKALSIALKDIQILLKDRGAVFQLLILPLMFVLVYTGALGAVGSSEAKDTRIPLAVVDLDGGDAAKSLAAGLDAAGGVRVTPFDQATATAALDANEIPRLLTVPAGFTAAVAAGGPATLRLLNRTDANPQETEAVRLVVDGVARDMSLGIQLFAALRQMGEMQASDPATAASFDPARIQAHARRQFEAAQTRPLITVAQTLPQANEAAKAGAEDALPLTDIAVPGIIVLFVFMAAQTTARSIYDEKKVGSFRRLLAAPMSKAELLIGKLLPNFITAMIQIAVILLVGIFGLRLIGLPAASLGAQPFATLLVLLLIALCSSALGIAIAAFAHTEGQIGGLSMVLMWGMGILGGCLVPLFLLERFLGPAPKIVPHYWANHALLNLMVRGLGFADVALDMAALLGFTVLFFAIGLWRFDFD